MLNLQGFAETGEATMNLTLDDLIAANANGSLESLLLGYGMLPLDVLKFALEEAAFQIEALEEEEISNHYTCDCEYFDHYDD